MTLTVLPSDEGVVIEVRVKIRASRNVVVGVQAGVLQVAVSAPPVQGAANQALCVLIAKTLGIAKTRVQLVSGEQTRRKRLLLAGLGAAEARSALECG